MNYLDEQLVKEIQQRMIEEAARDRLAKMARQTRQETPARSGIFGLKRRGDKSRAGGAAKPGLNQA